MYMYDDIARSSCLTRHQLLDESLIVFYDAKPRLHQTCSRNALAIGHSFHRMFDNFRSQHRDQPNILDQHFGRDVVHSSQLERRSARYRAATCDLSWHG